MKKIFLALLAGLLITVRPVMANSINDIAETDSFVVPNKEFREIINNALNQSEDYNPTVEDLKNITSLKVRMDPYFGGYVFIDDYTGLELMENLEELEFGRAFFHNETLDVVAELPKLRTFTMRNSYVIGNQATVTLNGLPVNKEIVDSIGFNPTMNIGKLGKSQTLKEIDISLSNVEFFGHEYQVRGNLITEGLENLSQLESLTLNAFVDMDDEDLNFLYELENLQSLAIHSLPVKSLDALLSLDQSAIRLANYLPITDFSKIAEDSHGFTTFNVGTIFVDKSLSILEDEEFTAKVNTGIIVPEGSTNIDVNVDQDTELVGYEIIDGVLHLNVKTDEFKEIDFYNPVSGVKDRIRKGFRSSLSFTLKSGVAISYGHIFSEVSDTVIFDLNHDDQTIYDEKIVISPIDENGLVRIPSESDFGLNGYIIESWYEDSALTVEASFTNPTPGQKYYAKLEKAMNKFTVDFDSNGGSSVEPILNVLEGSTIDEPQKPTRENYKFEGWYTDSQFSSKWNFSQDKVTENLTLVAKWTSIKTPPVVDPEVPTKPEEKTPSTGISSAITGLNMILISSLALLFILDKSKKSTRSK